MARSNFGSLTVIDAHVHLWDPNLHDHSWLRTASASGLQRSFGLDDLAAAAGPVTAVVIEAGRMAAERCWLLELAARSDYVSGIVVYADLDDAALLDTIDSLRAGDTGVALVGLRDPVAAGVPARLSLPRVRRSLAGLGERGLTVDLLLGQGTLDEACTVAADLPEVRFVLDHAGISTVDVPREDLCVWAAGLSALGRLPNVVCKLSGLGAATARLSYLHTDDLVQTALDAFGPHRLMFGSDWPFSTQWSPYRDVVEAIAGALCGLTGDENAAVWGGTARKVYGLEQVA